MSAPLPDVRSVIEALGGVKVVAEMFGLTENAIWNWVAANRFPSNTYVAFQGALRAKRRVAPDGLWRMAQAVSKPSRRVAEASGVSA